MTDSMALLTRIEHLESQLTFQEDTIESLNQLVTQQSRELTEIHERLRWLGRKVSQLQNSDSGPESDPSQEPPPPHY
ncbi:MAG: SlyX protein [Idiomarina sp.]|nr:SlyX family protein [Idiomarina sp.]PHQ77540.1 MAG: SlyX protein [Idiomarina sp.]